MLKKQNRLTKKGSFAYVYGKGRAVRTKTVTLVFVTAKSGMRIGFSVSNKAGNAVSRNKIKRRMRAIIREMPGAVKPCQAVFAFNKAAAADGPPTYKALLADMRYALDKAGLLRIPTEKQGPVSGSPETTT
ncbi:MAG: ribonuclease P protein component [Clostridiales bacterium]|jgi:ribonuclease P protein component|nr:ribonuclease P protein component [Clostridiales bacterium]